jgi:hypothetical protein
MFPSPSEAISNRRIVALVLGVAFLVSHGIAHDLSSQPVAKMPASSAADYYVSLTGNDASAGSASAPFRTLTGARVAVAKRIARGLAANVLVQIEGGRYELDEAMVFEPEDSGTDKFSITYAAAPGETVILSGGHQISKWGKGPGEIWTTTVPKTPTGQWYFRQLFVNGVRAVRARTPNQDSPEPWLKMISSTANADDESTPVTVRLGGYSLPFKIQAYRNPGDVEFVYINNNDEGRKRAVAFNEQDQTMTLSLPNRWNSKTHTLDWYLSFPDPRWKACYLENALEMLDEPGEWYLDHETGVVSYWPRPGEDMNHVQIYAPAMQRTLLVVAGTRDRPVLNLHFRGLHIEDVDWPLPDHGYMGLFCSMIDSGPKDRLQHGFIDAAVEYRYARFCSFTNGSISHVGAMGLCLREGTADMTIEGNEISDTGAGGIGISEIRQNPIGKRPWNPVPHPDDYQHYRIANNHIFNCGTDYYGSAGITLAIAHDSVVVHNLIHDIAYSGIQWGGDVDDERLMGFTRNNTVAFNHIYRTMKTTVDGAGLYVTFAHAGETLIQNNLVHDIHCNPFHRSASPQDPGDFPCVGLYLDGNMSGGLFEHNVVFNNAGGPLLFNSTKERNGWSDNLFQNHGSPPGEFVEVMQAITGLEPAYQHSLLGSEPNPCKLAVLASKRSAGDCAIRQYELPTKRRGVIEIIQRSPATGQSIVVEPQYLSGEKQYALKAYQGTLAFAEKDFYTGYKIDSAYVKALGDLLILSNVIPVKLSDLSPNAVREDTTSGKALRNGSVAVKLGPSPQVIWVAYQEIP